MVKHTNTNQTKYAHANVAMPADTHHYVRLIAAARGVRIMTLYGEIINEWMDRHDIDRAQLDSMSCGQQKRPDQG